MARFTCNFISHTLLRTVDITVVVPSATIPEAMAMNPQFMRSVTPDDMNGQDAPESGSRYRDMPKFPVLYLLHGMGNNHATWTGYTNVEMYAEERNIAVVMISAENKSYVDHASGDKFYMFIEEELPDFVKGMLPISDRPEDTFIAGLSMGGFGTLVHALNNPDKFAALGAFSAAIELDPSSLSGGIPTVVPDAYKPRVLAEKLYQAGGVFPAMYLACGSDDFLIASNRAFAEQVREYGATVVWDEVPGFGHEWRFWDLEVERFLDWLPRKDAYAGSGRRRI